MQNAITIAAQTSADHVRHHARGFASRRNLTAAERAQRVRDIEACAGRMAASITSAEYEAALADAQRLGVFPYLADVALVARAAVLHGL